jgi:hypothetical protein
MHRFALLAAMAVILLGTTADAATRKKPGATTDRSTVATSKSKPQRVSKPAAPSRQGWPTSWSDGSFRYHD